MSIVANEYGYKRREVAKHLKKDPAIITRYLKERNESKKDAERVFKFLKGQ